MPAAGHATASPKAPVLLCMLHAERAADPFFLFWDLFPSVPSSSGDKLCQNLVCVRVPDTTVIPALSGSGFQLTLPNVFILFSVFKGRVEGLR